MYAPVNDESVSDEPCVVVKFTSALQVDAGVVHDGGSFAFWPMMVICRPASAFVKSYTLSLNYLPRGKTSGTTRPRWRCRASSAG